MIRNYCFYFFLYFFYRTHRLKNCLQGYFTIHACIRTDNIMPVRYCVHVYYSIFPGGKFTLNSVPLFSYTILNSCLHRGLMHRHAHHHYV